jgi:hypothetical protein
MSYAIAASWAPAQSVDREVRMDGQLGRDALRSLPNWFSASAAPYLSTPFGLASVDRSAVGPLARTCKR